MSRTPIDQLLIDAISNYSQLDSPTKFEATQLDILTLPLAENASIDARRMAASALSACKTMPEKLFKILVNEDIEIAAPLLISNATIKETWLIAVAQKASAQHLEVLSQRKNLPKTVLSILKERGYHEKAVAPDANMQPQRTSQVEAQNVNNSKELEDGLRKIMMRNAIAGADRAEQSTLSSLPRDTLVSKLINSALGNDSLGLQHTIAKTLKIDRSIVKEALQKVDYRAFAILLKALGLGMTDAFAIATIIYPVIYKRKETIALFYLRYSNITDNQFEALINGMSDNQNMSARLQSNDKKIAS